jgi:hypothetical protein
MPTHTIYTRTIREAEKILGGSDELQRVLREPRDQIAQWRAGQKPLPMMVFFRLLDVIEHRKGALRGELSARSFPRKTE